MKTKRSISGFVAVSFFASGVLFSADGEVDPPPKPKLISTDVSGEDVAFLQDAGREMVLQRKMAEIAVTNSDSEAIKNFAASVLTKQVLEAHTLSVLSEAKGVAIPEELDASQKKRIARFRDLEGVKFDKFYLEDLIESRQVLIERFEPLTFSDDPGIKAFAKKLVSSFREHLLFARRLTGIGGRTNSIPAFRTSVSEP